MTSILDEIRDLMEAAQAGGFAAASEPLAERPDRWFARRFGILNVQLHRILGDVARR